MCSVSWIIVATVLLSFCIQALPNNMSNVDDDHPPTTTIGASISNGNTDSTYKLYLNNFMGYVDVSNNTIYDQIGTSNNFNKNFSISLDEQYNQSLIDLFVYNNVSFEFEFKRHKNLKIYVKIDKFAFNAYFSETDNSISNENNYLNSNSKKNDLFNYCQYPIPNNFDISIDSKWIDSGISNNYHSKIAGNGCKDSNKEYWSSQYQTVCDSPTGYLNTQTDKYVKIFECSSTDSIVNSFKYYYTRDQLKLRGNLANHVKIEVIAFDHDDNNSYNVYTVISKTDSYAVGNLLYNRALSHPYNWNDSNAIDNKNIIVLNASEYWQGDVRLLAAMSMDEAESISFDSSNDYSFLDSVYINEYNSFYISNISETGTVCRAFNDSENVSISVYFDIGLSTISTGMSTMCCVYFQLRNLQLNNTQNTYVINNYRICK